MIEPATITRDAQASTILWDGRAGIRAMRAKAHRRARRHVRLRLHACRDYDALVFSAPRLTGWDLW